jgi:hydrogenase expression/formation protein HypC
MCLAVPLQILRITGERTAMVRQAHSEMEVDVSLLDDPRPGEFVIVHAGFAIQILELQEAEERLELFRRIGEAVPGGAAPGTETAGRARPDESMGSPGQDG